MRVSSVTEHTVPPLYACYLLRSQRKPNVTYVGSTPDPERRLRQHNGSISQGAFTTRFSRPWQMDLLVCGFPSRLAALQFEWSWQHPDLSRHLRQLNQDHCRYDDEISTMTPLFPADRKVVSTSKSGYQKTSQRVSGVPEQRILVMRALLASEPFCFWDLHVVFFNEWAYGVWLHLDRNSPRSLFRKGRNTDRYTFETHPRISCEFRGVAGTSLPLELTSEWPQLPEAQTCSAWQKRQQNPRRRKVISQSDEWTGQMPVARDAQTLGLQSKDIKEAPQLKQVLSPKAKKASPLLGDDNSCMALEQSLIENKTSSSLAKAKQLFLEGSHRCGLCKEEIHADDTLSYSMCPSGTRSCTEMFHIECLAKHNLSNAPDSREFCLPISSECPSCTGVSMPWPKIVRRVFRRAEILS